jgi:hypothetical protein
MKRSVTDGSNHREALQCARNDTATNELSISPRGAEVWTLRNFWVGRFSAVTGAFRFQVQLLFPR